ncbi:hypothetical protein D6V22_15965 [Vibrio cholerae]|nr:conserved hypothetical protein [Vibrio cholerae RC385]EGQ8224742.1 hypothetical protein [Vibrio cholerae]EGQ8324548.1 hypothetical protein [Vibrio cholerae]EGQ8444743.1 hypothetical protein [Vibrio cholerae]EGQ9108017.1 hypothetical protein [Vibrio cholerae]
MLISTDSASSCWCQSADHRSVEKPLLPALDQSRLEGQGKFVTLSEPVPMMSATSCLINSICSHHRLID